jgi:hypothetical protein
VWIVRHNEWYHKDAGKWTLQAIEAGLGRAEAVRKGPPAWLHEPGRHIRGYRSRIDGSVQPYAVILPKGLADKAWRLDVILHGRDTSLTEVKFIHQYALPPVEEQPFIQLHVYGRGNNAYRWAGEQDIEEALGAFVRMGQQFFRKDVVDPRRLVLRGFSMGGAGAWHYGLRHPDIFCSVSPGAGFTTTHGYVKNLPDPLPLHQEACLRIYDAANYAENASNVPIVAYGGDRDPQLQAARNIEARLKPLNIPLTLLVGENTEHRYHPDSLKQIMELQAQHAEKGKPDYPDRLHFVTYTPQHGRCFWLSVLAQERQYEKSLVKAERKDSSYAIETQNIRLLHLTLPPRDVHRASVGVTLDGQKLEVPVVRGTRGLGSVVFHKEGDAWKQTLAAKVEVDSARQLRKTTAMTGPIDAAFMRPFLCLRGTGKAWNSAVQRYADADLKRFQAEWDKHFRGELFVKDDTDVTTADMLSHDLILFGDPGSNGLIGHVLDRLPLQWTKEQVRLAGQSYSAADHLPALIYPSPLGLGRYVVLNSGHTFHAKDFEGTNALLYPRLGDFAILKVRPDGDPLAAEPVTAGLFDELWRAGER